MKKNELEKMENTVQYKLIDLRTVTSTDPSLGSLTFIEENIDVSFLIKKVYFVNKSCRNRTEKFLSHAPNYQLLICLSGHVDILLKENDSIKTVSLSNPSVGLFLIPDIEEKIIFTDDSSILCILESNEEEPNENFNENKGYSKRYRYSEFIPELLSLPYIDNEISIDSECCKDIPFEIRRLFFIYGIRNQDVVRGRHSNRKSKFVLFNIKGSCKVKTIDENRNETVYTLNQPTDALYLPRYVWKEMYDFSEDSVLIVLSSEYYNRDEYIRNFDDYVKFMHQGIL